MYYNLFYELIQVAIGRRGSLSRVPSAEEWSMLYGLALKQAGGVLLWGAAVVGGAKGKRVST